MNELIVAVSVAGEFRIDSRTMAVRLDNKHRNVMALLSDYDAEFSSLGILPVETEEIIGRGQPAKYAYLNEDQCYFLLTLVRNSPVVVGLKVALVQTFSKARAAALPAPAADFSQLERLAGLTAQAITVARAELRTEITAEIDTRLGDLPITGAAKNEIYMRVKRLAVLMGGRRSDYQAAWSAFKIRYNLAGYGDLPARLQPEAVRFVDGLIAAYAPNENLLLSAGASA